MGQTKDYKIGICCLR